jgi:hypothetical protein
VIDLHDLLRRFARQAAHDAMAGEVQPEEAKVADEIQKHPCRENRRNKENTSVEHEGRNRSEEPEKAERARIKTRNGEENASMRRLRAEASNQDSRGVLQ